MSDDDSWYVAKTQDDGVIARLQARIAELEAEKESWGNEFNAIMIMKDRVAELVAKLAFAYAECQHWRNDFDKQSERVASLEMQRDSLVSRVKELESYSQAMARAHDENARLREALEDIEAGKGDPLSNQSDGTGSSVSALMRRAERALSRQGDEMSTVINTNSQTRMTSTGQAQAGQQSAQDYLRSSIAGHPCPRKANPAWRCEQCEWLERAIAQHTGEDKHG